MWYTISARYGDIFALSDIDSALSDYVATGAEDRLFNSLDK